MIETLKDLHHQWWLKNDKFDTISRLTGALFWWVLCYWSAQIYDLNTGALIPLGILSWGLLWSTVNRVRAGYLEVMKNKV